MPYLSLRDLYSTLNLLPKVVEPLTNRAYEELERKAWVEDHDRSPHGKPWHTSFHASRFPMDENACPRAAQYELMDLPPPGPTARKLRGQAESGKFIENELVRRWHEMGWLLSPPPTDPYQLGLEDPEIWLTCSFDSVMLPPGWNKPFPVEVKSKALDKVREMIQGTRGPDPKHEAQIKVQIGFLYLNTKKLWPHLEPCVDGALYYVARDDPSITKEFRIKLDPEFMENGAKILTEWKTLFENEELPHYSDKKHPLGEDWRWSEPPCKWCPFKKHVCKPDWEDKITKLEDSNGIEYAKTIRPSYDYTETRNRVLNRWNEDNGS